MSHGIMLNLLQVKAVLSSSNRCQIDFGANHSKIGIPKVELYNYNYPYGYIMYEDYS